MPDTGVYLVNPLSMASLAALSINSGVPKSGSPAPKPTTSIPSELICLALASIDSVNEGVIAELFSDNFIFSRPKSIL